MICSKCQREFEEKDIQESHDVPCYLFLGDRRIRKQAADHYPRRWLCKECHKKYEKELNIFFVNCALKFSKEYFNG
jgi:hypothetical protein